LSQNLSQLEDRYLNRLDLVQKNLEQQCEGLISQLVVFDAQSERLSQECCHAVSRTRELLIPGDEMVASEIEAILGSRHRASLTRSNLTDTNIF